MPHDIARTKIRNQDTTPDGVPKNLRPSHVMTTARKRYDEAIAKHLEKHPNQYSKAVKAGLKAYDKVLHDYDRRHRETANSSHS